MGSRKINKMKKFHPIDDLEIRFSIKVEYKNSEEDFENLLEDLTDIEKIEEFRNNEIISFSITGDWKCYFSVPWAYHNNTETKYKNIQEFLDSKDFESCKELVKNWLNEEIEGFLHKWNERMNTYWNIHRFIEKK
jgi:hypothetical protein